MKEYEYNEIIAVLIKHIQYLSCELASTLCDVGDYLTDEYKDDVRFLRPEDINSELVSDPDYHAYIMEEYDGYDPLTDEVYLEDLAVALEDNIVASFYPRLYSRRGLRRTFQ